MSVNVFSAIGHFFKRVGVFVADAFIKIFGADAAHNFAVAAEGVLETDLGKLAWAAVNEVEGLASGTEKQAAAFTKIMSAAASAGLDAKASIVNMLIEIAVQKLSGMFGPAAS